MKLIFFLIFLSQIAFAQNKSQQKHLVIEKDSNNYSIYSQSGELLLEFTPRKTDSASLSTFEQIYTHSKQSELTKTNKDTLPVNLENIHELDPSFFAEYIVPILSIFAGIVGVFIGWLLTRNEFNQTTFEQNFFKMLDTQDAILNTIEYTTPRTATAPPEVTVGRGFFALMMKELKNYNFYLLENDETEKKRRLSLLYVHQFKKIDSSQYHKNCPARKGIDMKLTQSKIDVSFYCYSIFFKNFHNNVGHYFRHLYHIIKYVDDNKEKIKKFEDPQHYADLIQARMSAGELFLLFYNNLLFPAMKVYVDKYRLTENLAIENLMEESHKEFVPFKMKSLKEHTKGLFEINDKKETDIESGTES